MNRIFTPGVNDHGVDIRNPSTANLYIDSLDRVENGSQFAESSNFTIASNQSLMNGFFTRLGMTEIVLDWSIPNISTDLSNNTFDISFNSVVTTITLEDGIYNVKSALDTIVSLLNAAAIGVVFSITQVNNQTFLAGDSAFEIIETELASQLKFVFNELSDTQLITQTPNLNTIGYLEFVCNVLTNNQKVKDGTTNTNTTKDVIYRWNFAWDNVPTYSDAYGFPINQGYAPFRARRYLSFPKQINWSPNQPIGNLNFQVYDDKGVILNIPITGSMEFTMNLLVSEI